MPSYFLHLHECGEVFLADEPIERTDLDAAHLAALAGARDVMRSEIEQGRLCLSCHIEIQDHLGATLRVIPFREAVSVTGV